MSKLSKAEVQAIGRQVQRKLRAEYDKHNIAEEKKATKAFYKTPIGKATKRLEELCKLDGEESPIPSYWRLKTKSAKKLIVPFKAEIEDRIILSQFEAKGMDDLISSVTQQIKDEASLLS